MSKFSKAVGFSEEEKRIRKHMIDRNITQKKIASDLGLARQDVSNVVCGISRSPRYVKSVYDYIGLDVPESYGAEKRTRAKKVQEATPPADIEQAS